MTPNLQILPIARRNYRVFSLVAIVGFAIAIAMQQFEIKLPAYLLMLCSLVCAVFGVAKRLEPEYSFTLTPNHFTWHLKHSDITIGWKNFIKLTPLKVNKGQGQIELNYIGVKLWDVTPVLETVSVRSAKNLFHEYRSLLHVALLEAEFRQDDPQAFQEDAEGWTGSNGYKFTGVKGMFAARLQQIKSFLGADLYIPTTSMDRHIDDFIQLFDTYQKRAHEFEQIEAERVSTSQIQDN